MATIKEELPVSGMRQVAVTCGKLPLRDGKLPYITAICLIPDTGNSSFIVAIYI